MKRMWIWILLASAGIGLFVAAWRTSRAGYESAPYQVVRTDGPHELRDYPALTVVETPMATARSAADGSFGRLFRFITGANAASQKIAMTTPVFMAGGESGATMAFVMPAAMTLADAPKPSDPAVVVRELPAGRFAVRRFVGGRSPKNEAEALAALERWMRSERLVAVPGPIYGYFDPPWTPPFLRRNEVMLRIANSPVSRESSRRPGDEL